MDTLLDSKKYSDLILRCQDKTWEVHRAVLCTKSKVFEEMVDGDFKEAHNREIALSDDNPEIVEKMLRFMYQGEYNDERGIDPSNEEKLAPAYQNEVSVAMESIVEEYDDQSHAVYSSTWGSGTEECSEAKDIYKISLSKPITPTSKWSEESLLVNVKVYILADKNNVSTLKDYAKKQYQEIVEQLWNTRSFPASAKLLYDNTPESDRLLRDVIAETAKKNILALIEKEEFVEVMTSHGDLAVDVLKSVLLRGERSTETTRRSKKKGYR